MHCMKNILNETYINFKLTDIQPKQNYTLLVLHVDLLQSVF